MVEMFRVISYLSTLCPTISTVIKSDDYVQIISNSDQDDYILCIHVNIKNYGNELFYKQVTSIADRHILCTGDFFEKWN